MATPISFHKATRKQAKASILIEGLSGKGKSGLALKIAKGLADNAWDKIYAVDSENKSLSLYVGINLDDGEKVGEFNVVELDNSTGYKPTLYKACRDYAIKDGGSVYIADSITHMWQAKGGVLDMVNEAKKTNKDSYAVWGEPEIALEKNTIMDLIRSKDIHTINTVRVKEKMEYVTGDDGRTKLEKLGALPIISPEIAYEPDLVLIMEEPGTSDGKAPVAYVEKSRYAILTPGERYVFNNELIAQLKTYLDEGVDPESLLEQQRLDYVKGMKEYLDTHVSAKNIWKIIKKDAGVENVKLEDLPLDILKTLYNKLVSD